MVGRHVALFYVLAPALVAAAAGPRATAPVRSAAPLAAPAAPRLVVLGTVQDGGLPHVACTCVRCERARREPGFRRHVASLALHLPASDKVYLLDATPDLGEQLDEVARLRGRSAAGRVDRAPVDGVFLTHAHVGHYLGLAFFGFETVHARRLPVWASPRMADFLRGNGPWSQLVKLENVELRALRAGEPVALEGGVSVTPLQVPHRDEYSDTLGFFVRGPRRTVLYVPDTDSWRAWARPLPELLAGVDEALLDGTFYSLDELPGRDVASIGHPLIADTMELLAPLVKSRGLRVAFTHLNHSNPALEPESAARQAIAARGFRVLAEGEEIGL
ncbi:MAG TPA: MBL fold metallo-hydrolase [Thermoanaerobaculia bacterium]